VNPLRPLERKAIWGPLIWTVGIIVIWGVAQIVLNPGVTRDDIQECVAEGIFPPDECEETLQALEDEDEPVVGIPLLLILWLAGLLLLSLVWMTGPKPPDSS
jgi:hypothetical protein